MDQRWIGVLARMELARAESVISEVLPRGQFFGSIRVVAA